MASGARGSSGLKPDRYLSTSWAARMKSLSEGVGAGGADDDLRHAIGQPRVGRDHLEGGS